MTWIRGFGRGLSLVAVLTVSSIWWGCMSDKGANEEIPFESERYPALQAHLDSALTQLCTALNDALEARLLTDTAVIPGLNWPFEMPPRRRDGTSNAAGDSTSWGVGYNRTVDTTKFVAFWDLGRFSDTGVLIHTSPLSASRVRHTVQYSRVEGFGDDAIAWDATLEVYLSGLDFDVATAKAELESVHNVGERCDNLPCDVVELVLSNGTLGRVSGEFDLSTFSAALNGHIKLTEFDVILGFDAVYDWEITGTVANGVATVTLSTGQFSATDIYPLCP